MVALGALTAAVPALAQQTSGADDTVGDVIVTGARVSGRTVEEAVAPIDIISSQAIERGYGAQVLEQIQSSLPSFFVQNSGTPNIGSMVRAGQLRGQNAGHTLVLVNGKRRHTTAFLGAGGQAATAPVDLAVIASSAIRRIEVLRDGASAIYGSDAIAGVINIITDDSPDGGRASYRYGQYFAGDGETSVLQLSQGFRIGDNGHLRLSGQHDDQKIVIRNGPINPDLLFYFPINPATGQAILPSGNLESNPQLPAGAIPDPREATRDNNAWINSGKTPFSLTTLTADFGLPLAHGTEIYSFLTYARRDAEAPQNFRTPNRNANVRAIYPDGYTPVETIDETDTSGLFGIRGDNLFGWQWDASTVWGRNAIDVGSYNTLNATYGRNSPTSFFIGSHEYTAWTSNFDVRRSLDIGAVPVDLSAGVEHRRENYRLGAGDPEGYTHGGVAVEDGPNAGQRLPNSFAVSQAIPAYRPDEEQDIDRHSTSLYFGASLKPTPAWTVDLAVRGESFSDFGEEVTWRASSRYDISPHFAVRGTVNSGFKAPALAALSYRAVGNANTTTNYTLAVTSAEAQALGARPLEPEKAINFSAGFVARILDFNLAVDAFQIEVENRITQLGSVNAAPARRLDAYNPAAYNPVIHGQSVSQRLTNGLINPGDGISYLINSSDIRTRGVEVTADRSFVLPDDSVLRLSYAGAWLKRELTAIYDAPSVLTQYNPAITLLTDGDGTNLTNTLPRQRHIFSADLNLGRVNLFARQSYWGALPRSGVAPAAPAYPDPLYRVGDEVAYDLGAFWTTDVSLSYAVTDNVSLTLTGNNIFEAKPERTPGVLQAFTQLWSYGNNGAIGAEGGFWSVKLDVRW